MERHFLLSEVAKILNRKPHQVVYQITSGKVNEPELRIANKRLFTESDVQRLGRQLGATPNWSAVGADGSDSQAETEALVLRAPFDVLAAGECAHEVRDGNGEVFAWTADRGRALVVAGLLQSASRG
jgi:hypothetical protein